MRAYVTGAQMVINNLMIQKIKKIKLIAEAVEKTAVSISNHAKMGHEKNMAHIKDRFETQTGTLVLSIKPEMEKVTLKEITARIYTEAKSADFNYPAGVEFGTSRSKPYPFMFPALVANIAIYKVNLFGAMTRI